MSITVVVKTSKRESPVAIAEQYLDTYHLETPVHRSRLTTGRPGLRRPPSTTGSLHSTRAVRRLSAEPTGQPAETTATAHYPRQGFQKVDTGLGVRRAEVAADASLRPTLLTTTTNRFQRS